MVAPKRLPLHNTRHAKGYPSESPLTGRIAGGTTRARVPPAPAARCSPARQHVVHRVATFEILRLLLALGQLIDALDHVFGELEGGDLPLGVEAPLTVQAFDHRKGEEAMAEL